jgi:hypothetical protein
VWRTRAAGAARRCDRLAPVGEMVVDALKHVVKVASSSAGIFT